jgi:SNF2 family DNA or RNA helicase
VKPDLVGEIRRFAGLRQAPAFREMLASAYLRRRREDVLEELPPLTIENEWCAMTEQDREAYAAAALDRNFVSMRRVSFLQEDPRTSSKALRLAELCEQACSEGRRVVVFSYFRETIRKVVEMLGGEKTSPVGSAENGESATNTFAGGSMTLAEGNSFAGDSTEQSEKSASAAGGAAQTEKSASAGDSTEQSGKSASAAGSSEQAKNNSRKYAHMLVGEITGSTPVEERQALIDRFSDSAGGGVLVCQIQAGGTGLNIQAASVVIFCEPQIKPSLTRQALSRVYRMGQVRTVLVFHLLCEDTVDEAVMRILDTKQMEFDLFAEESVLADAADDLADREWIRSVIEEERSKYLPAIRPE